MDINIVMFNKKYFFILLLVIVSISAISCASAVDFNSTDDVAIEDVFNQNEILDSSHVNDNGEDKEVVGSSTDDIVRENSSDNTTKEVVISTNDVSVSYKTAAKPTFTVTNKNNSSAVSGVKLLVQITSGSTSKNYSCISNDEGIASISVQLAVGKHKMTVNVDDNGYNATSVTKTITVKKLNVKLKAPKVNVAYGDSKYITISVLNSNTNKAVSDVKVKIKVYTSKSKYKTYVKKTDSSGKIKISTKSLAPGTHKVVASIADSKNFTSKTISSSIKVSKKKLVVNTLSYSFKDITELHISVGNKATKKLMNGVKLKVKVYTGKKAKTFTIVTGYDKFVYKSDGIAFLLSNKFSVGTHKVKISVSSKYYTGSKNAKLKIAKSTKNYPQYTMIISKGKVKYI